MKVVVTGETGFLGGQLVARLEEEGCNVEIVSRSRGHDIRDPATLVKPFEGANAVFHLAALVQSRPGAFDDTNVTGFRHVLEVAARNNIERFVYVSSFTIFGPSGSEPHVESDLAHRSEFFHGYDRTKYQAYELAQEWSARLPMNSVFPGVIYGPGKLTEGNILVRMFQRWIKMRLAALPLGGRPRWNFVHVGDVVDGLWRAWQGSTPSEDFILGGPNVTLSQLYETFREVAGRAIWKLSVPATLFRGSAYLEDWMTRFLGIPPLVTPSTSSFFLNDWAFSSQRASERLGYRHRSLDDGLRDTYEWMQQLALV